MHPLQESLEGLAKLGLPIARKYLITTTKRRIALSAYSLDEALTQLRIRLEAEGADTGEKVVDIRPAKPAQDKVETIVPTHPATVQQELKVTPELVALLAEALCWGAGGSGVWENVKGEYLVLADRFLAQKLNKNPG